jgi:hypothetical protein
MASSFKSPILQAIDQNGNPVPGAKLFAFASGTTTPVVIYSNQSLTTPLPNPLIANARGYFASAGGIVQNIWWDGQALRLRLTGPDDSVIWEIDDYSAASGADPAANINVTGIWAGGAALTRAALKARSVAGLTGGEVIQLNAGGRSGQFAWVAGNQSANVTADPQQGIWVAPDSDPTGASGAWRRLNIPYVDGWVNPDWFGAVGDAVRRIDGNITSGQTAFTVGASVFSAADVGKSISIAGAGAAGAALNTTIAAFVSGTAVTLANAAGATVSNAVFNYGTNDQPAFQAAVNWIASSAQKLRGGTVQYGAKSYWIDGTVAINERGITLRGHLGERTGANTISSANGGLLLGASTSGPVVGVWNDDIALTDVEIGATPGRQTAAISRSPRGTNCAVSVETADLAGAQIIMRPTLTNVLVRNQPAEGFLFQGELIHTWLLNCTAINCGGHLYAMDNGELVGRVNKGRPGIANFYNCRGFDAGGHLIAIGHPDSGASAPYRVTIMNFEGFRSGLTPAQLYDTAGWFLFGEQIISIGSASSGTSTGNVPTNATLSVAGRDIAIRNHRYINGTKHVLLRQRAGFGTRLVHFDGGFAATDASPVPTNFIEVDAGVRQVRVTFVDGGFTNVIDNEAINGLIIDKPAASPGGLTVLHRADMDFANSARIIRSRGTTSTATSDAFALLSDGEFLTIAGNASSSATSGMLRINQPTAATGDANIRLNVGTDNWIFGQRRSNNSFCVRNSTAFSNAGNIVNIISDGGTNGFVGIGPNTTVPAYRVDVDGSINVRTGGAFRFNGTQVVGAQGTAIADATGGTEITTINAILARLRAHGLIAT